LSKNVIQFWKSVRVLKFAPERFVTIFCRLMRANSVASMVANFPSLAKFCTMHARI